MCILLKKILVDMLEKAIDSDLLTKNATKQIDTVISKEERTKSIDSK